MLSDTRFPNYVAKVFEVVRESWPALVKAMEEIKEKGHNGDARAKKKALEVDALQGDIFNVKFVVRQSLLIDVYNVY